MAGHGAPSTSEPIIYVDHSDIREGSLDELKAGVRRLVDLIGGAEFRKLAHFLTLTAIECYGRPSEGVLDQLRRKAAMLGDGETVVSIGRFAGFTHLTSATS